ncbi:MAG: NAD(P)-dependent oxidoreductase [Symploca sp. SIO2E6]|nr:NAD(P)-dependent oxidoreductase [Symploca sp. SIO2E6]
MVYENSPSISAPETQARIVISGASGWLGCTIADQAARMHRSIALDIEGSPSKSQLVANLASQDSVEKLLMQYHEHELKADTFIHCAGLAHRPNETDSIKKAMWAVNDRGTARALEFCERAGISKFLYVSAIAGYDWTKETPAKETDILNPKTEYAKSKLAGEERTLNAPIDGRAVRLATVFGSGDKANFLKLSFAGDYESSSF